jgi:protein-S-isoprenylcysteine O-methyltransferase Ste14
MKMYNNIIFVLYIISTICLWILLSGVILNFYFSKKGDVKKEKKSVVETGSMLGFFIIMVILVYRKIGTLYINNKISLYVAIAGTVFIIIGTIINIAGRLKLKDNWGNQIRIYKNHTLVNTGIYKHIRHPLYSSTILMIYGFSFLFVNPVVFLLNTIIFIPFMIYRAKQEDELLYITFKDEFIKYKSKTGLFIPKIGKGL